MAKKTSSKYKNLSGYSTSTRSNIIKGMKSGNVRFEPSNSGGEYIYSGDKTFGRKKKFNEKAFESAKKNVFKLK